MGSCISMGMEIGETGHIAAITRVVGILLGEFERLGKEIGFGDGHAHFRADGVGRVEEVGIYLVRMLPEVNGRRGSIDLPGREDL